MSWTDLAPIAKASGLKHGAAVTLSVSRKGSMTQRAFITVRPALLPGLDWWTYGASVSVQVGDGEHAGRVRVRPDGPFRIMPPTGKRIAANPNAPMLQAPLTGLPPEGLKRHAVAWEVLGGTLVLTLPWAGVKGVVKPDPGPLAPAKETAEGTPVSIPCPSARWTDERKAVVARDYPAGVNLQTIVERINALPGADATGMHVNAMAGQLKVRRPVATSGPATVLPSNSPAPTKPLAPIEIAVMRKVVASNNRMSLANLNAQEAGLLRRLEDRGLTDYQPGSGFGWSVTQLGSRRLQGAAGMEP